MNHPSHRPHHFCFFPAIITAAVLCYAACPAMAQDMGMSDAPPAGAPPSSPETDRDPGATANVPLTPESKKALAQEAQANVVLYYVSTQEDSPDATRYFVLKPRQGATGPGVPADLSGVPSFAEAELTQMLPRLGEDRSLAVVIMNRSVQRWPETLLEEKTDVMSSALRAAGFQQFVLQFERGPNRVVHFDSAE
jgi:hypothetical protein